MDFNIKNSVNMVGFTALTLFGGFACSVTEPTSKASFDESQTIRLYTGRPSEPIPLFIKNSDHKQRVNGALSQLPDNTVKLARSIKDTNEDAVTFTYQGTWFSNLYFNSTTALNLTPFIEQGVVSFDMKLDDVQHSALDLIVGCGQDCHSKLRLREWAMKQEGKGWQSLSIPLQCFNQTNADFSAVYKPFSIEAGGMGQFVIANVKYKSKGEANFHCPDMETLSTSPATLNEYWSVDWWLPRHHEKVTRAKQGNIDLLMVGDSITHGWEKENEGLPVWKKHFSDVSTLNIGFGGDRTENVLWRLAHDTVKGISPKLAVVMIGTNNTGHRMDKPENIAKGVRAIVKQLQKRLPKTKVLLLDIFPRGENSKDKLRINNSKTNVLLAKLAQEENILFDSFNQGFLTAKGELSQTVMPDLLHPNQTGYEIWADLLTPYINLYVR